MASVKYIGFDVHKESITAVCHDRDSDTSSHAVKLGPDPKDVLKYLCGLREQMGNEVEFRCGYEAGCTGYGLQRYLEGNAIECTILAPSTMAKSPVSKKKKNDSRDAEAIARCLANGTYSAVSVPRPEDEAVRDFIRMRDDLGGALKRIKQQINSFCLRHGHRFTGTRTKWTKAHDKWLRELKMSELDRETLDEYMLEYDRLTEKIGRLDKRIVELAAGEDYADKVGKLGCFLGLTAPQSLALIAETGDFSRFRTAPAYAAWLGLLPGEDSSGDKTKTLPMTKAGNTHLRRILIESSGAFQRGKIGYKSIDLKKRQQTQDPADVAYADRANERLRRKCQRMIFRGRPRNVAVAACARELACFVWGMMTGHTGAV